MTVPLPRGSVLGLAVCPSFVVLLAAFPAFVVAIVAVDSTINMASNIPFESYSPSKLGEYKVVNEIAEGTFGKVKSTYFRASYPPLRPDTYPPLQWPSTPSPVTRSQ